MNKIINSIIENLYDAAILYNLKGTIVSVNQLMLEMFNIDRKTALSYPISDFFNFELTSNDLVHPWDNVYKKKHHVFELDARNPVTGAVFDVEIDVRVVDWSGEEMILVSMRDISARKKIEKDLKESENKFKSLFKNAAIPQLLIEGKTFIDCNKNALAMIGFSSKKDIIGLTPADISPQEQPDGTPSLIKADQFLTRTGLGGSVEFEWVHKRQSGEIIYSIVILTPIIINKKTIIHTAWIDITKRKETENTLIESQRKYKSIFEGTNDAILLLHNCRIIDCNQRALDIFGYDSKSDIISLDPDRISPPIQHNGKGSNVMAKYHIEKTGMNGTDRFEWIHQKANGEVFPCEVVLSSFEFNGVRILHSTIRDISERNKSLQALYESEERYRILSDVTFEGILVHDNGIAIDVNLSFCKMFGYSREELVGKNVIDLLIVEEYQPLAYQNVRERSTQPYEVLCRRNDGTLMWQEVMGKPFDYISKSVRVTAMRDVTERKKADEAIKESEAKFRRITESSLDVIITVDSESIIRFVSPSITRFAGYKPEELTGLNLNTLISIDEERINVIFNNESASMTVPNLFEASVLRKDGTIAVMEISIVPITTKMKTIEYELYARDISDRKNLEQEIIRTSELERQRIGQDLHDGLGQTLTGISIMLGTVARKVQLKRRVEYDEIMIIAKRVEEAIETTRQTARGLYPVTLKRGGLIPALREMVSIVETNYGINCTINHRGLDTCKDIRISTQIYYIVIEAVNNALRHSKVKNILIDITINEKNLVLIIENEGKRKHRKETGDGIGKEIMHYRADMIGASLTTCFTNHGYRIELTTNYD